MSKLHVITVLDRSGSMSGKMKTVLEAYNGMLASLKGKNAKCSLVSFDDNAETAFTQVNHTDVKPLKSNNPLLMPRGLTALYDAMYQAIQLGKKDKPTMVQVLSDGGENASRDHNRESVQALIKEYEKAGWEFQFVGMDIDAKTASSGLNLSPSRFDGSSAYNNQTQGTVAMAFGAQGDVGSKLRTYYENTVASEEKDEEPTET